MSDVLKAKAWNDLVNASDAHSAERSKARAQELSDAAKRWAASAVPVAGTQQSSGAVFPPYGNAKGQPVRGASKRDLEFYRKGCERSLADSSKERFHEKGRALLAAIDEELAR